MDAYFKKIQALQQDRSLAPRLRFMLMDLIDLRAKVRSPVLLPLKSLLSMSVSLYLALARLDWRFCFG
jgi:hypothetical protein